MKKNRMLHKNTWKRAAAFVCAAVLATIGTGAATGRESAAAFMVQSNGGSNMEGAKPKEVSYAADDYENWNRLLQENEISEEFAQALSRFAFESGSRVLAEGQDENVNYSPISLYYALALAGCGAEGETAAQILGSLGVTDQAQLAEQCKKLYQTWHYSRQKQELRHQRYGTGAFQNNLKLGNSLWISERFPVKQGYQKLVSEQFFAPSYQVDFSKPETGQEMGRWIAEQTGGVLEPNLQMDAQTVMAIVNTLYFYGGWETPFQKEHTAEDTFTRRDGSMVTVPYLNRTQAIGSFRKGDGCLVSALETGNNARMVFLLPDENRTVEEFVRDPAKLAEALGSSAEAWQAGQVTWKVPKFSFGSSLKLEDTVKAMGMEKMFGAEAEFGGISASPLLVSNVIQESHIGVDEVGVEGAAYTMIVAAAGAYTIPEDTADMILNRPFLYGIQDRNTGAWLFLGVCQNPAEGD